MATTTTHTPSTPAAEAAILTSYLLEPAALTAAISYEQFRALFPPSSRGSPALRALFRDLRAQRAVAADAVAEAVREETRRGVALRREVVRARRAEREADEGFGEGAEADGEVEMERALFGDESGARLSRYTINSMIPELEGAADALETEILRLESEEASLSESLRQTVGELSDLRYGKFSNPQLRDEIVDGLASLQEACLHKS